MIQKADFFCHSHECQEVYFRTEKKTVLLSGSILPEGKKPMFIRKYTSGRHKKLMFIRKYISEVTLVAKKAPF
jgi:hypothetical protein